MTVFGCELLDLRAVHRGVISAGERSSAGCFLAKLVHTRLKSPTRPIIRRYSPRQSAILFYDLGTHRRIAERLQRPGTGHADDGVIRSCTRA